MMYAIATVAVNPPGAPALTRAQVWAGLVLKARDARQFLPPGLCSRCEVLEDSATHLLRSATIGGQDIVEIVHFEPGHKVTFFQAAGPREGAIVNRLHEDAHGALQLSFYCYLGLRDKAPGGPEEQAEQAWLEGANGYRSALLSTLQRTRELVAAGAL